MRILVYPNCDLLIAALACALGLTLVTDNTKASSRIHGLAIETLLDRYARQLPEIVARERNQAVRLIASPDFAMRPTF